MANTSRIAADIQKLDAEFALKRHALLVEMKKELGAKLKELKFIFGNLHPSEVNKVLKRYGLQLIPDGKAAARKPKAKPYKETASDKKILARLDKTVGLSQTDIAEVTKLSALTVGSRLKALLSVGKVAVKPDGTSKLWTKAA